MGKFIDGMLQMHKNFCDTLLGEEKMKARKIVPLLSEFAKKSSSKDTTYTLNYKKKKPVDPGDEETEKLLAKKAALENELSRIDTLLDNKRLEVDFLNRFEEGKWYEYFEGLGFPAIIFKYSKNDFIRDDQLWVHNGFSKTITKMQSSFEHTDLYMIPLESLEVVKEVDGEYVQEMIEGEIAQLKGLES